MGLCGSKHTTVDVNESNEEPKKVKKVANNANEFIPTFVSKNK